MTTTPPAAARPTASTVTDDQLDRLYAERDRLAAAVQRVRETCDRWDGFSPTTRRHSIIVRAALDGPAANPEEQS